MPEEEEDDGNACIDQWMAEECPPGSSDCQREELRRYCIAWVLV